ncbi:MAG: hypothetical protein IPK98_15355 [Chloracidobacterium sp.]|nr:hypothetical protein [Chloracidobacterium sp.]
MEPEIEALKSAYAGLNHGDVDGFVKDFDPQIVRVEFEGSPMEGKHYGIEAVKAHVKGRSGPVPVNPTLLSPRQGRRVATLKNKPMARRPPTSYIPRQGN